MWILVLTAPAVAGQVDRWVSDDGAVRTYHIVWDAEVVGGGGLATERRTHRTDTTFSLEIAAVEADRLADAGPTTAHKLGLRADAIRAWASREGIGGLTVAVQGERLTWSVEGRADFAVVLEQAGVVGQEARDAWMPAFEVARGADGKVERDLAAMVASHAAAVRPLALALQDPLQEEQGFAERALQFVQSLPYEARRQTVWGEPVLGEGGDHGVVTLVDTPGYTSFRRPLSLLDANTGDCDGKTVLYLALIRALYPDLPLAVVRVPGHVYGGVSIEGWDPGATFEAAGRVYTVVEPTGPGLHPPGAMQSASREATTRRVLPVPLNVP